MLYIGDPDAKNKNNNVFSIKYLTALKQVVVMGRLLSRSVRAHHMLSEASARLEHTGADSTGEGQPRDVHGLYVLLLVKPLSLPVLEQ